MPWCADTCQATGTIGNDPVPGELHLSTVVCASPGHQAQAMAWVAEHTGKQGVYRPFPREQR